MVAMTATTPDRPAYGRGAFERMVCLIRAEFDEMPGMRLTRAQFQRLWHITESECDAIVRTSSTQASSSKPPAASAGRLTTERS